MKDDPAITWRRTFPECEPGTDGVAASSDRPLLRGLEQAHDRRAPVAAVQELLNILDMGFEVSALVRPCPQPAS